MKIAAKRKVIAGLIAGTYDLRLLRKQPYICFMGVDGVFTTSELPGTYTLVQAQEICKRYQDSAIINLVTPNDPNE